MLEIKNLHANVDGELVLKGVNLSVLAGEVHAIMGPNGSGKSTLSNVIAGKPEYEITDGEIVFDGKNINDLALEHKINPTLLFSKKDQKDFLSEVFSFGVETALNVLPRWKKKIISNTILSIQFNRHD